MICKECNLENDKDARFCENCGTGLQVKGQSGLEKMIWSCIVLLYVFVVGVFVTNKYQHAFFDELCTTAERADQMQRETGIYGSDTDARLAYGYEASQDKYHRAYETFDLTKMLLGILIICVFIMLIVLLVMKKIKLSFGITAILLCIYAVIPVLLYDARKELGLIVVFVTAIVTILIYKYSFAENKKLL
ncbi:zinc-ribbon domain-containing protein [Dysgonomonas termitidis]|uniref:Zinc-ribbon domain-containing protein n=1 Tax=Dysgonomonas termitidis TaxID=1516126 RepID=A0ABV9L3N1_9BACT